MSAELEQLPPKINTFHERLPGAESMTDWLSSDVSARYRLRSALQAFDIEPAQYVGGGYINREFIDVNQLVDHFELPIDPAGVDGREMGFAILRGCIELRDDLGEAQGTEGYRSRGLDVFAQLPTFLQYFASYKVIGRLGAALFLSDTKYREQLHGYFCDRLHVPDKTTEDILQSAAIVHADNIIDEFIALPRDKKLVVPGVEPAVMRGPRNPEAGVHLGYDLEQAVTRRAARILNTVNSDVLAGNTPEWMKTRDEAGHQGNIKKILHVLQYGVEYADTSPDQMDLWRSYLMTKSIFALTFRPRKHDGFDGNLDQLVSWTSPVPDGEYLQQLAYVQKLRNAATGICNDTKGVALGLQSFVFDVLERVEQETVLGHETKRSGRIQTAAKLLREIMHIEPQLAEDLLQKHSPLRTTLHHAMDPWGAKFNT